MYSIVEGCAFLWVAVPTDLCEGPFRLASAERSHRSCNAQSLEHPELIVTWGSEFPDKLKLRKQITLWPLRFKLRADYNRTVRNFEYGCSCKVSMVPPNSRLRSPSPSLHCANTEALPLLIHYNLPQHS